MNRVERRAKANRDNGRRIRREEKKAQEAQEAQEAETNAGHENYSGITIIVFTIGILSGLLWYRSFAANVIASWNTFPFLLASFVFTAVLGLAVFGLSSFLLKGQLLTSKRLAGILYFGSVTGVIIGVMIAALVNWF